MARIGQRRQLDGERRWGAPPGRLLRNALSGMVLLLVLSAAFPAAVAAEPDEARREHALRLGREGVEAYNAQRYEDAVDRFTHAEALVHSPVFTLYLARIARKRGHGVKALELYDRVLAEQIDTESPEPWRFAQEDARIERDALVAALPSLRLVVVHAPDEVSVWVDKRQIRDFDNPVPVDPGTREIAARRGQHTLFRTIEVKPSDQELEITIELGDAPTDAGPSEASPAASTESPPPAAPPAEQADQSPQQIAGYVLLGTGAAAALALAIVGGVTVDAYRDLDDQCREGVCPGAIEDDVYAYDRLRLAILGLGIGAVVAGALGGVLLGTASPEGTDVALGVGPSGAWVAGRF